MSRLTLPGLFFAHFLFVSHLFWAGGLDDRAQQAFVGVPLKWGHLTTFFFSQNGARGLVFILGLLCAVGFTAGLRSGSNPWKSRILMTVVLGEAYFLSLDLRLWTRYPQILALLTVIYLIDTWFGASATDSRRLDWMRVAYLAVPLSGPWSAMAIFILPLYLPNLKRRNWFLTTAVVTQALQGHFSYNVDYSVLSCLFLVVLFSESPVWGSRRSLLLPVGFLTILVAWSCHGVGRSLRAEVSFRDQTGSHTLIVKRHHGQVTLSADKQPLGAPWYIDKRLYCNPHFFTAYPDALSGHRIYKSYLDQLRVRCAIREGQYTLHQE
jgi:hypothetical protein